VRPALKAVAAREVILFHAAFASKLPADGQQIEISVLDA
jgi:hypothetical protein